jgi:hypothetical protein
MASFADNPEAQFNDNVDSFSSGATDEIWSAKKVVFLARARRLIRDIL